MSQQQTYRTGRAVRAALLGWSLVVAGAIGVGAEEETSPTTTISQPEFQGSWTFNPEDRETSFKGRHGSALEYRERARCDFQDRFGRGYEHEGSGPA